MVRRETQKQSYWEKFAVQGFDLEYLYGVLLEKEVPLSIDELALAVIEGRCKREEKLIKGKLEQGRLFQPKESYEVGERLVFPAFDYALGTVINVRPGRNPKYEPFKVIRVRFEESQEEREFASELKAPDALKEGSELVLASPEELFARFGEEIKPKLIESLQTSKEFVNFRDQWFLDGLLADIHVGHLNIAEAAIEVKGVPLSPEELLKELDFPTKMKREALLFSLNYALSHDDRFDEVGTKEQILWFLHRLEPPQAVELPFHLRYRPEPYDRSVLDEEMLGLEREIADELVEAPAPGEGSIGQVTIVLTYPHRRAGTIPLTAEVRGLFPWGDSSNQTSTQRTFVTFIDGHTGKHMPGWVVHKAGYVYGLGEWYEEHELPTGAYIQLECTEDPLSVRVSYLPKPRRRGWVRVAKALEGKLAFELQMRALACDYDELMIVDWEDPAELDELSRKVEEEGISLFQLMCDVFPELAKLSPQGTVHFRTLYSAINIERRCPPGPILAELATRPCFIPVGDGYWIYDENLREWSDR